MRQIKTVENKNHYNKIFYYTIAPLAKLQPKADLRNVKKNTKSFKMLIYIVFFKY